MLVRHATPRTRPTPTPLSDALSGLLAAHRPAFKQERPFRRIQALLFGCLFSFARRTVTQALVALGLTECDWSAFYRLFNEPRLDYEVLSGCFFGETLRHVPEGDPYVAVVDGVQVPRHSHRMPGTSWLKHPKTPPFMPGPHRAQRFLHLAALLPQDEEGFTRALPLSFAFNKRGLARNCAVVRLVASPHHLSAVFTVLRKMPPPRSFLYVERITSRVRCA